MNVDPRPSPETEERLLDLLAEQAAGPLSPADEAELSHLLADRDGRDDRSFETAAAAIELACAPTDFPPLPAALAARIAADAKRYLADQASPEAAAPKTVPAALPALQGPSAAVLPVTPGPSVSRRFALREAVWAVAAVAACLVFALLIRSNVPPAARTLAERRAVLLREAPDVLLVSFVAGTDPTGKNATGDLVWSTSQQRGFMRFRGLAPNDPARERYQLWIFDAERDERYPVDGGLFDLVAGDGEIIVPIDARLHIGKPILFAVTVEKPGGVVVSTRERLPLLAKVPPSSS